jgi:hypothetical protein
VNLVYNNDYYYLKVKMYSMPEVPVQKVRLEDLVDPVKKAEIDALIDSLPWKQIGEHLSAQDTRLQVQALATQRVERRNRVLQPADWEVQKAEHLRFLEELSSC